MDKKLVLGVCGSIAAYKSPEIVREFRNKGWDVKVVMTRAAREFITPLTIETVSCNPAYLDMFDRSRADEGHIALSDFADIILVAPASASIIGRVACGICDDLLTCTICAFKGPVIFAPAMNSNMWENGIVAANVKKLEDAGYLFAGPEEGPLASGKSGMGRLAGIGSIVSFVEKTAGLK